MFLKEEERKQGEVSPSREQQSLKLSEAIRIGCPLVEENDIWSGCALGTGYFVATGGRNLGDDRGDGKNGPDGIYCGAGTVTAAEYFGIPLVIAREVSTNHHKGSWTREECADWLEAQGY